MQLLPDRARGESVAREVARQPQHGSGIEKGGPLAHDDLEVLVRVQRATGLQQHPPQLVAQVVKSRPEGQRRLVLRDRFVQAARLQVGLAERRVLVGQLGRDVAVETPAPLRGHLAGASQHGIRLFFASQLVQHERPMNQRLDVVGIEREGAIELLQRLVRLSGERVGEAEQMVRVRKRAAGRDDLLEEMNRTVIVLQLKPLVSLLDQMLGTDVHESPRTSQRTCGSLPRCRRAA